MNITRIGVDLAKNIFQVHGVNRQGEMVVRKQLRRTQMLDWFGKLAPWSAWKPAVARRAQ